MNHLSRFAAIPFGFVVVAFAIANRGPVEISLDPLPFVFAAPLYLVAMGGLAAGFAAGAAAAWLAGHGVRRRLRLGKARIALLEGELSRMRASADTGDSSQTGLARLPADAA
jgi:hypothetical protein